MLAQMAPAPGVLTIDLDALVDNWRRVARDVAPAQAAAVVKADAYGLGAGRVVPALAAAGCRAFFVANLVEALAIRPLVPDDAVLAVLNGLHPGGEPFAAEAGITPVLNSVAQARRWQPFARPAMLQVDTGMARHGLDMAEAAALAGDADFRAGVPLLALISHLACADEPDRAENADQLARFAAASALFPGVARCFANSGGVQLGAAYHGDMVRAGLCLYGAEPADGRGVPFRPVVGLAARVLQTRTVAAGTGVGYGQTWQAPGETRLALLSIGYADGFPRSLSGRGAVWAQGALLPIVGRVSMDVTVVDASALSEGALTEGDLVEIIGPHCQIEDVAQEAGTIAYEILTQLGHRYERRYL
ncbi:alanine racemase [Novosphingobium sp. KACC 22771]|uniref:alanine racemase n=1 Tax=Novosphingobium sp. KACC 22771 TaxID=3025670 RepID=UPI002365D878|nr:alanine racemase [Novosphingobium sp. KACC 22771]WDF73832.1 alanine racemase [Novosphingobium sp. KACC 22771]